MAGFKLADAFVELKAKTKEHDGAIDKSIDKVKSFGKVHEQIQQIGTKGMLAIGAGAASMEGIISKAAMTVRSFAAAFSEAHRQGKSFGDGLAIAAREAFGLESAVTRLSDRMKEMNRVSGIAAQLDLLGGRGGPAQIAGLTPEQSVSFQAQRAGLTAEQETAQAKLRAAQQALEDRKNQVGRVTPGQDIIGPGSKLFEDVRAAEQAVQDFALKMKQLNADIEAAVRRNREVNERKAHDEERAAALKEAAQERQSKIDQLIDAEKQRHMAHERMRNEQLKEAAGIFAATRTPEEKAREELAKAEAAFRRGDIDRDTLARRRAMFAGDNAAAVAEVAKETRRGGEFVALEEMARRAQAAAGASDEREAYKASIKSAKHLEKIATEGVKVKEYPAARMTR
jgi:hypothetical protein